MKSNRMGTALVSEDKTLKKRKETYQEIYKG